MHRLLKRQIRRYLGHEKIFSEEEKRFIQAVEAAYSQFDDDREMLERALELSSQELMQTNSELRAILEAFPDLFFRITSTGEITYYKTGSSRDIYSLHSKLLGKRIQDIPDRRVGDKFEEAIEEVNRDKSIAYMEYSLSIESDVQYYEARLVPLLQDQIIVIIRNITVSKKAEQALREEKERLDVTLRSIGDGVITTNIHGNVVLINRVAEELTGWPAEEAKGIKLSDVFQLVDERSGKPAENPVERCLATGRVQEMDRTTILVSRDGTRRNVADSAAPIKDHLENSIGVVVVFRDITEKLRLEEEFLKTAKLESIGILAGGIAHDFNNILNAVLGNITLSKSGLKEDSDPFVRLTRAEMATYQARELTQQLLTFAKGGKPVRKPAYINDILWDTTRFVLSGSNVKSDVAIDPKLWPVEVDKGQLTQVWNNLIINAIQAMPGGGVVRIRADNVLVDQEMELPLNPGRYVRITIQDEGTGIAPENVARIFDPYFTTKEQGSGLGLATCYSIIQKHEGHIQVESEPERGTTFTIFLPASALKVRVEQESRDHSLEGEGRVLLMDDEEVILEVTCELLENMGYETTCVTDGKEAVDSYVRASETGRPFDVVIMDLTVPGGMGGKEAIKLLREIDPDVRAIVSSGYSQDPVMADYKKYGFDDVLAKPYKVEELGSVLNRLLSTGKK